MLIHRLGGSASSSHFHGMSDFPYHSLKAAVLTDKRVKVVKEVIEGIRVIKMYAWEYAYGTLLSTLRRCENQHV